MSLNCTRTRTRPQVASTEIIDRRTPNAEVCMAYGYSAMVFDQRVFVTYNPFNLYVTQPEVKPGCILRRSNVSVLEREKLVTDKQVCVCVWAGVTSWCYFPYSAAAADDCHFSERKQHTCCVPRTCIKRYRWTRARSA